MVIHALESLMAENCFDPIEFEHRVVALSKQSKTIGDLLVDLEDPDPVRECLPYLGDAATQERLIVRTLLETISGVRTIGSAAEILDCNGAYVHALRERLLTATI
ncbi:MAG: hypothetical protein H0X38_09795, partial [Planctomycetes bacterium]|nr:hypothetical protein [Planctomycetota bacterium]